MSAAKIRGSTLLILLLGFGGNGQAHQEGLATQRGRTSRRRKIKHARNRTLNAGYRSSTGTSHSFHTCANIPPYDEVFARSTVGADGGFIFMRGPTTIRRGTRSVYEQAAVRSGVFLGLLLFVFVLVGCAIVPMKTRTVGTTGKENRMNLKFIQVDETMKDEVTTKLAWMDTGLKHQRLFWGRWYGSSSGGGSLFIPTEIPLPIPNGTRYWRVHNVLVEFNGKGVVERFGEFSDGNLNEELERWLKEANEPPLNLSAPLVIQMETTPTDSKLKEELEHWLKEANEPPLDPSAQAQLINQMKTPLISMTLTDDLLQFILWNGQTFSVPPKDITRFQIHNVWLPGDRDFWGGSLTAPPFGLHVLFSFRHWGPGGKGHCKCYMVEVSPADYLTLVRYMGQTRPGS